MKKDIWKMLIDGGLSAVAAAAVMGNMEAESGIVSCRLQGDFTAGYTRSAEYVKAVDGGGISREDFVRHGPGGGGFGLMQWTFWSRKDGLYQLCMDRGVSIADEKTQVEWFFAELHSAEYRKVYNVLTSANSIRECSDILITDFLRPANQSVAVKDYRANLAAAIYNEFADAADEQKKAESAVGVTISEKEYEAYSRAVMVVMYLKDLLNMLDEFGDDFHP